MSAIFGVYNLDERPLNPGICAEMADILKHRGPDEAGIWNGSAVGLGHRLLRTTPESESESMPQTFAGDKLVITADARLDNRQELIERLDPTPRGTDGIPGDSDIILFAYRKWGEDCVIHLLGDFAFAIWDAGRRKLFCARDHFGVRSFYYYASAKQFAFATEIKALLLLPEVSDRLNEKRVAAYLRQDYGEKEQTFYRDIRRLPPGHVVSVGRKGTDLRKYWQLELGGELELGSDEEYAEALNEHFTEAVRCRLRSSVPVGTMLSGGLDSSSITCLARKLYAEDEAFQSKRLQTFSAVFDRVTQCDERRYINTVLSQNGVKPNFTVADDFGPFVDIDEIQKYQDEPVDLGNLYVNWLAYKAARERGVGVILDGFDGDSTISHGLGFLIELAESRRWVKLTSEVIGYSRKMNLPWLGAVWEWFRVYGLDPQIERNKFARRVRGGLRRRVGRKDRAGNSVDLLSSGLAARTAAETGGRHPKPRTERETHRQNLDNGGAVHTLEVLGRAAGPWSVEVRFPFWDKRLVEFCLSLPAEQKIKNGWTRLVMRRAMEGVLPPEIQWRRDKSNLTPSFNYGLFEFGQQLMDEFIIRQPEYLTDFVNIDSLRSARRRFLRTEASEDDVLAIQRCISLALWLQKNTDNDQNFNEWR
jgi:asparagine synthase (glutamine-hydrolysing)